MFDGIYPAPCNKRLHGQISAVTFCAKIRTKATIKNVLGEPGVTQKKPADFPAGFFISRLI